jgi:hypothetical protein
MKYAAGRNIYLIIIKELNVLPCLFPLRQLTTKQTKVPASCFTLFEYILTQEKGYI